LWNLWIFCLKSKQDNGVLFSINKYASHFSSVYVLKKKIFIVVINVFHNITVSCHCSLITYIDCHLYHRLGPVGYHSFHTHHAYSLQILTYYSQSEMPLLASPSFHWKSFSRLILNISSSWKSLFLLRFNYWFLCIPIITLFYLFYHINS
jgi:hypothetical protein